jgi:hypothetical protein
MADNQQVDWGQLMQSMMGGGGTMGGAATMASGGAFWPVAVGSLALGAMQTIKASRELKKLKNEMPSGFQVTPEQMRSYQRAESMAQNGFTSGEKASFFQNLAQKANQAFSRTMNSGGGSMAAAVRAGLNYGNTNAINQFAMNDASLNRNNIRYADQMGADITAQRNRETARQWARYQATEQALGTAKRQGWENMANSVNATSNYWGPRINWGGGSNNAAPSSSLPSMKDINSIPYSDTPVQMNQLPWGQGYPMGQSA